ncbi:MAG: PQQ-binding-like beta-propeller repeat protein [Planctomycetes bacterium]|nr:PQQ-binding-like beta-propeller repeat protein [Planctomycetota bacterium]
MFCCALALLCAERTCPASSFQHATTLGATPATQGTSPDLDSAGWTRFRGPNGSGVSDRHSLPASLGDEHHAWSVDVPLGHSSPVVFDGRIYLSGVENVEAPEGAHEDLVTLCLELASGKTLWKRAIRRPRKGHFDQRNNAASPTPCCDARGVIVFFPDLGLIAYDASGAETWRQVLGPFRNVYGMGASPVLEADRVVLVCDQQEGSFIAAWSRNDGKELWRTERPFALSGHCTPISITGPKTGARRIVAPGSFYLDVYDITNGTRDWFVAGLACEMKSTPVTDGTSIYINGYASPLNQVGNQVEIDEFRAAIENYDKNENGQIDKSEAPRNRAMSYFDFVDRNADGALDEADWTMLRAALASQNGMLAIRIDSATATKETDERVARDLTETNLRWAYRRPVPQLPSPLLYRGILYLLADQSGLLTMLDPTTGDLVERGRLESGKDNYYASPVAGDGKLWLVGESGLVSVVRAGKELETIHAHDLGEACYATPALVDGRVLIRSTKRLHCYR